MDAEAIGEAVKQLLIKSEKRDKHTADVKDWLNKAAAKLSAYKAALSQQQDKTADLELITDEQQASIARLEDDVKQLSKTVLKLQAALDTSQVENLALREQVKAGEERSDRLEQLIQPCLAIAALFANVVASKPAHPSEGAIPKLAPPNTTQAAAAEAMGSVGLEDADNALVQAARSALAEIATPMAARAEPKTAVSSRLRPTCNNEEPAAPPTTPRTVRGERVHQTSVTSQRYSMSFHTAVGDESYMQTIETRTENAVTTGPVDLDQAAAIRNPLDAYKAGVLGSPQSTGKPGFFKSFTKAAGKRTALAPPARERKKTRKLLEAEEEEKRRVHFTPHGDDTDEIQFDTDTNHAKPRAKADPKFNAKAVARAMTPAAKRKKGPS
ncbi:hypothetical protein B0A48_13097 [Cryoendolithus antarcticus]|uniref:Uncharacterized protein n=1 Tax=Cryoendolithus antarcticus TaxID=1507870 RepID=A0A1V8SN55_9PEZI|nr:hypothetical protein B0A48_13097 [Cryoendolithus antarcticus]